MITFRMEGLEETVRNLGDLPRATQRNVVKRILMRRAEPVATMAAQLAPEATGRLAFSIAVSTQLTRRQKRGAKLNEVEVYIGPAAGAGSLYYASFREFGTAELSTHPYMRPAWDSQKDQVLALIGQDLGQEVERAAARAARKAARAGE